MSISRLNSEEKNWVGTVLHALSENDPQTAMGKISAYPIPEELQPIKLHLLGLLSIRLNNFVEALNLFKRASDKAPLSKVHFEAASYCATKLGMLSDSLFYLKMSATCPEPDEDERQFLPDWMGAVEDQLINIQERPFLLKAKESLARGRYPETLQHLQQALNADPFHVDSWLVIQEVMQKLDRKFDSVHAIKAALDSGDVPPTAVAMAALTACKLAMPEADAFFAKAMEEQKGEGIDKISLCFLESLTYQNKVEEAAKVKETYLAPFKAKAEAEHIVQLSQQVNLGLFSGRFNSGKGIDPFVDFIFDVISFGQAPWLATRIFFNSEDSDMQTNRLKSTVRDFRPVEMIDPVTLSRILRNEKIHMLWDLDGLTHTGAPQIHQEDMIPYRLLLDQKSSTPKMVDLIEEKSFVLDYLPVSFPRTFAPENFEVQKGKDRKVILLSLNPCELTDELLDMLARVKTKAPFFDLLIDTRKVGGIAYLEVIEAKFKDKGLSNFIQFNEVREFAEEYQEELYGKADYILSNISMDALQPLYTAMKNNCSLLIFEDGGNYLIESFISDIGLKDRYFNDLQLLETVLVSELEDDASYVTALERQNKLLVEFSSIEQRVKRVKSFVDFIEGRVTEAYGDAYVSDIFLDGGDR